jgi:TolA-binding protein
LADAARYARQDALGQKTLLALRERFPQSELARDSAFLLGRLSRDQRALEWYERYLSEQPKGTYVSQALGRSMMLCFELGDRTRAKGLALSYLERFPSGPYAASARKLSDGEARGSVRAQSNDRGASPRVERAFHAAP